MKFFTPERTVNYEWAEKNKELLISQYNGKCVLIDKQRVIESNTDEQELYEKAKIFQLDKDSYIVMAAGDAIPQEVEDGIWW